MRARYALLPLVLVACAAIGSPAGASWPLAGTPVCVNAADKGNPIVASDGAGGMFVLWQDSRVNPNIYELYGARFAPSGDLAPGWPVNGKRMVTGSTGSVSDIV